MEKKNLIENETEKTLGAFDGIGRVGVNPYLYNKILNGINEPIQSAKKFNFKLALGAVIICFLANLVTLFSIQGSSSTAGTTAVKVISSDSTRNVQIKTFASEYLSTNNFYFY
jgi:hypothetical protein